MDIIIFHPTIPRTLFEHWCASFIPGLYGLDSGQEIDVTGRVLFDHIFHVIRFERFFEFPSGDEILNLKETYGCYSGHWFLTEYEKLSFSVWSEKRGRGTRRRSSDASLGRAGLAKICGSSVLSLGDNRWFRIPGLIMINTITLKSCFLASERGR